MATGRPVGILRFLGTNCDRDVWQAVEMLGLKPEWLWYADRFTPSDYSAFLVPGGFSYGDYLRCGALAAKAPALASLAEGAGKGMPVLGICNGFQILCESRLLPGALVRNESRRFIDKWVELKTSGRGRWSQKGQSLKLPIAHGEGRFVTEESEVAKLFDADQVWCTYSDNPNGSLRDIAGVSNAAGNVCGLMPHPERAMADWMGGEDGRKILSHLLG
jgi:phosphoribosylformylglycinamidine synthase